MKTFPQLQAKLKLKTIPKSKWGVRRLIASTFEAKKNNLENEDVLDIQKCHSIQLQKQYSRTTTFKVKIAAEST